MLSGKMYRFRANVDIIDPRFLELYLMSPDTQVALDKMKTGISDSGLNLTNGRFLGLPIVVPPIEEQQRIVDILDDHLSRLDAAEESLRTAGLRAKAWQTSFVDRSMWHSGWPKKPVAALLSEPLRNGHSARASADGRGIRTLTLTAVTVGRFEPGYTKMTVADPNRVSDLWLCPGDILIERSNTPELVGTSAYYDGPADWAIFPDLIIRVRVNGEIVRPQFAGAAMSSARAGRWLRGQAKGLSGSMPKIDQGTIGALRIPIPSLDEQDTMLARMAEAVPNSRRMTSSIANGRQRTFALRRALLQTAFSGRLTGRSSDVDRAEELLA